MIKELSGTLLNLRETTAGILIKSLVIVALGFIIFHIDDKDFFELKATIGIILTLTLLKCAYFVAVSYHKILEVSIKNTAYHEFILFIAMNIFVIVISFATDFFCISLVDPHSLKGIPASAGLGEKLFDSFYFSILNFSFFGYGDIIPVSIPAKVIMICEALISFLTVILVLSDFISLKESIAENRKRKMSAGGEP